MTYPIADSSLPFAQYIEKTRAIIAERRPDIQQNPLHAEQIIEANSPFEFYPAHPIRAGERLKYGVLLIHGLFDSAFTVRDLGHTLQKQGMLCRSILLPGHGTLPSDLFNISYHHWIEAVRYGIESLKNEVDAIYLVGYSTGAALSIYHALQNDHIAGIILLAPAIKIRAPVDVLIGWQYINKVINTKKPWLYREAETDYAKYLSIGFNPVTQVAKLTGAITELQHQQALACPVFMAVSHEDETISSHTAIDFFSCLNNPDNQLLLYTSYDHQYPDSRILTRQTHYPEFNIKHFSHVSIPFSPDNPHYGQKGDYPYASHASPEACVYGAFNHVEVRFYDYLHKLGLIKQKRRELTYNPDFDYMANKISHFILNRA